MEWATHSQQIEAVFYIEQAIKKVILTILRIEEENNYA